MFCAAAFLLCVLFALPTSLYLHLCLAFCRLLFQASDVNGHSYLKEIKIINFYDFNKLKIIVFIATTVLRLPNNVDYNNDSHNETQHARLFN